MRHMLMDPKFPDLVRQLGYERQNERHANDNRGQAEELSDPLLIAFARAEIAATRCW